MKLYKAHSLGRFHITLASQAAGSPLIDSCFTREKEEPFRTGPGFLIRLPFKSKNPTVGLVIGMWKK